ncbi:hypothetical protein R6U79_13535 [Pseudomonas putida]|uniref:hypothetical protein n=1 Tax=Pseudomonas putida TaxID=303 RepID=UPI0029DE7760|nr:hypothetical protein [Pseudomonas putida]WPJ98272.1 hypothetical protein R6U79_13535 [Pseudomonas putida]
MISSIVRNWCEAEGEHGIFLSKLMQKYFLAVEGFVGPKSVEHMAAYHFIQEVEKLVLSHELNDILLSIDIFNKYRNRMGASNGQFVAEIGRVFNYKRFTAKTSKWNAYALCRKSKARICPYCNHAYAFTLQSENGDFRPTLDHFYFKDEYPHLALTLYNLVPSCASCNSSLKGEVDFYAEPHLNPLFDAENIQFYLAAGDDPSVLVDAIQSKSAEVQVKAKAIRNCSKTESSLNTFVINERYDMLSLEAIDFYLAKMQYEEAVSNTQFDFEFSEIISLRFDRSKHSQYLLGKMFADIYDSFSG